MDVLQELRCSSNKLDIILEKFIINFISPIFDLLHFHLFLLIVIHLSSIVNEFYSTLLSTLDVTSSVELFLKVDEVLTGSVPMLYFFLHAQCIFSSMPLLLRNSVLYFLSFYQLASLSYLLPNILVRRSQLAKSWVQSLVCWYFFREVLFF